MIQPLKYGNSVTCDMNELGEHCAEGNKPCTERQIIYILYAESKTIDLTSILLNASQK